MKPPDDYAAFEQEYQVLRVGSYLWFVHKLRDLSAEFFGRDPELRLNAFMDFSNKTRLFGLLHRWKDSAIENNQYPVSLRLTYAIKALEKDRYEEVRDLLDLKKKVEV